MQITICACTGIQHNLLIKVDVSFSGKEKKEGTDASYQQHNNKQLWDLFFKIMNSASTGLFLWWEMLLNKKDTEQNIYIVVLFITCIYLW